MSLSNEIQQYLQVQSETIHKNNVDVGWWEPPQDCIYQKLQLVSTEIAEATEGARKGIMDTHVKSLKMEEVEYADAMIRLLDLGGKLELYIDRFAVTHRWCCPDNSIGMQQLGINYDIVDMGSAYSNFEETEGNSRKMYHAELGHVYSRCLVDIIHVANDRGFELFEAIELKIAYNAQRADHKRHNREAAGGKSF